MNRQPDAVKRSAVFYRIIQVSQVTSGPRRGPTFNNRWWNDRRSWNLRTTNSREKASPKGANHIQSCSCSPPSGTVREYLSLSAGSIPFGHSTRGYSHSPPSGTVECYLRNFSRIINTFPESAARQNPRKV